MYVISDLAGPGGTPARTADTKLVASIDVEWSKNYRITNGNQAFCYSIVWLPLPATHDPYTTGGLPFRTTSVYLDPGDTPAQLVEAAAVDIQAALDTADLLVGHQLCSDLAVLAANAGPATPATINTARQAWHHRRTTASTGGPRIIDTRFDAGHLLAGTSRRLVDVCTELNLDVTQPELHRKSMTALHRDWLGHGDHQARERITLLNLRHSLSTAYVAARAAGHLTWPAPLNINTVLAAGLAGRLDWLNHPDILALTNAGKP